LPRCFLLASLAAAATLATGCQHMADRTDRRVSAVIADRQQAALGARPPVTMPAADVDAATPPRTAYVPVPRPVATTLPADFVPEPEGPPTAPLVTAPPLSGKPVAPPEAAPDDQSDLFTLTDALAFAQANQRAYQTAKEELYLRALALTLERHLWTPVFASRLRTVYGNFGQIRDFDQAMRFVAELSASQRLPYGGEFTAKAISTLIRDVGRSITASEGSTIEVGVRVPFLRGAGHVAQEDLIRLERELTYQVRSFERFRRRQLVDVASAYFDLLRAKQSVLDSQISLERREETLERARAFEQAGLRSPLDTQRAEFEYLTADNRLERAREDFRAAADRFKLSIGMPVEEPLNEERLEAIESIEAQVAAGHYPLLLRPPAAGDESRALAFATQHRLDLLTGSDRIDDARRGVTIAQNTLLPNLDLESTVSWETDPDHNRVADFSFDRTTWRSELLLDLPLERMAERNRYRASLVDVRRAQRNYQDTVERIRVDVRSAVNQIRLEDRSLQIQQENLAVANRRLEFAQQQYDDGLIDVRELLDAEDAWTSARNGLNLAKTSRWQALLNFRLATETLRIDENGMQYAPADMSP
jgi:outer membrane protein TolC